MLTHRSRRPQHQSCVHRILGSQARQCKRYSTGLIRLLPVHTVYMPPSLPPVATGAIVHIPHSMKTGACNVSHSQTGETWRIWRVIPFRKCCCTRQASVSRRRIRTSTPDAAPVAATGKTQQHESQSTSRVVPNLAG